MQAVFHLKEVGVRDPLKEGYRVSWPVGIRGLSKLSRL